MDLNGEFMFSICSFWFDLSAKGRDTVNIKRPFERPPFRSLARSRLCPVSWRNPCLPMWRWVDSRSAQWDAIKLVGKWEAHYNAIIMCTRCVFKSPTHRVESKVFSMNIRTLLHDSMRMFYAFDVSIMTALFPFTYSFLISLAQRQAIENRLAIANRTPSKYRD